MSNILPQVHAGIRYHVKNAISEARFISFTTDAWSSNGATATSLTAHWLTEKFNRQSAVLQIQPLEGSHTAATE